MQLKGFWMSQSSVSSSLPFVSPRSLDIPPMPHPPGHMEFMPSIMVLINSTMPTTTSLTMHMMGLMAFSKSMLRNSQTLMTRSLMNLPSWPVSMIILYMRSPMMAKNFINCASSRAMSAMMARMMGAGFEVDMRPMTWRLICVA